MELKIERMRLHAALKKASKATAVGTAPVIALTGVLLEADADKQMLKLTATDLTITMMLQLKNVDVSVSGKIVANGRLLAEMLGAMEGDTAEITARDSTATVKCGASTFKAPLSNADDFPNIKIAFAERSVCVTGLALFSRQNAAIVPDQHENKAFQGVQVRFTQGTSSAVSSDGMRFIRSKGDNVADGTLDLFIPKRALTILYGIVKAGDDLYIGQSGNTAIFMTSEFVFTTRLTDGNLTSVEALMEKIVPKYRAVVDSRELLNAVDSAVSMTHKVDSCVNISLTEKSIVLSVDNENGDMSIEVDAEKSTDMGGEILHYKPSFMLDFLKSCSGKVTVELDVRGVMKLRSDTTEYVISRRGPAAIKQPKVPKEITEVKKAEKSPAKKAKTTKGKAADTAA